MVIYYILAAVAGAVLALAIYIVVSRLISKERADVFLEKAVSEAETAKQQKMIEAKEHFLQLKSEHDRKVNEKNFAKGKTTSGLRKHSSTSFSPNSDAVSTTWIHRRASSMPRRTSLRRRRPSVPLLLQRPTNNLRPLPE